MLYRYLLWSIRSRLTPRRLVSRAMKFDGWIFDRFDETRILNLINKRYTFV